MIAGRVGLWLCSALLIAGASTPVSAQDSLERDRSTLMFVEYPQPAKFIGFPKACPGSSPEENPDEITCLTELYKAPAE